MKSKPTASVKRTLWRGSGVTAAKAAIVLAAAAVLAWAVHGHHWRLNDQFYFRWGWRFLPSRRIYPTGFCAAVGFFAAQWLRGRWPKSTPWALLLIMISTLALMMSLSVAQGDPPGFKKVTTAIINQANGGYFLEGVKFQSWETGVGEILRHYPELLPRQDIPGHFYNKPPGEGLFFMQMIRLFADRKLGFTAELCAWIIGAAATLSVPATYFFIRHFTADADAAFCGASYFALCPGFLLFFPEFDQFYPVLTAALTILWALALERGRLRYAAACGLLYGVTTFVTYLPVVLGIFLVGYAIFRMLVDPACRPFRVVQYAVVAAAVFVGFYVLLWLASGFDPIASFRSALNEEVQRMYRWTQLTNTPQRHLPGTILWDLYSFALGSGWISYLLVVFYFASALTNRAARANLWIALLCVAQFVGVALSGLVPGETVRIWIFMLPMLVLPIGLELARWGKVARVAVYAALLVLTCAICQSMVFML